EEFFSGNHPLLEKAYSPMTIRFFKGGGTVLFELFALCKIRRGGVPVIVSKNVEIIGVPPY
ncbi:MAG: hypothetical protein L5657_01735, partial [Calditerricola sp.]|nr:hypothetical protein [Calditerricola sp.]